MQPGLVLYQMLTCLYVVRMIPMVYVTFLIKKGEANDIRYRC
jgi:hypothetical protein